MRVSACVIVKNEEKNLPLWLDSMSRIADELVVVDTGSKDGTVAIARAGGARVEHFKWVDDFSAAKNFAFEQAKGDWILLLDADEYFRSEDCPKVRAAIEKYNMDRNIAGLMFLRVDIEQATGLENGGSMHVVRAFRNVPWLRYVRRIHEELRNLSGKGIKIMQYVKDLVIYHTGYSAEVFPSKVQRNLELLLKSENREPVDDYYLATCYYNLERYDEAISRLKRLLGAKVKMSGMENAPYTFLIHSMILADYPSKEIYGVLREAVQNYPEVPEFHILWGFQDWRCGDRLSAEGHYLKALKLNEEERGRVKRQMVSNFSANLLPKAYLHLGELAVERGRNQEAAAYFEKTLHLQPDNERAREALRHLQGEPLPETALSATENSMDLNELEELRAKIYGALERMDYNSAGELLPKLLPYKKLEALELMTCVAIERGDTKAAEEVLGKLRSIQNEMTPYQSFLEARILFMQDRVIETLAALEKVQVHKATPEQQEKIYNLMGQCHKFLGENKKATECYLKAFRATSQREVASWEYSNYLFNLHYLSTSIQEQLKAAEGFQKIFEKIPHFHHSLSVEKKEKIRIGYISPDLRNHVVLHFSHALFSKYDRERFEVFLYANNPEDGYSKNLAGKVDRWRNILGWSAEEAARRIYEDHIDILVDLAGHTKGNCLPVLAYKPAPVQISGIGYFASTGLREVDYFLGDVHMDNDETEEGFTEELLLLPESHFCYSEMKNVPEVKEAPCKRKGYITFGSFNDFPKTNDEVLRVWAEILREVPESRLLLKAKVFEREDNRELMLKRMKRAGISLERVEIRGNSKVYMPEYNDMDIALDTFPYPGGGTTCDALYMGVPVITLRGKSHGERFGASLLENIGLGELCADTREDYVKKAIGLAGDPELVAVLHANLRNMMRNSPVMNAARYMSNMEAAYEAVWERYVRERKAENGKNVTDEGVPVRFCHDLKRHCHEKIRVGYISPYFCRHIVSRFAKAFFSNFDTNTFEVCGYSLGTEDDVTEQLKEKTLLWRNIRGLGTVETARQIYKDEIDILVDFSWDAEEYILPILRCHPAPIQINGLNAEKLSMSTGVDREGSAFQESHANEAETGIEAFDDIGWRSLQPMVSPLCYGLVPGMPSYVSPAPCGTTGYVTFGCVEPVGEVGDELLKVWKEVMEHTEETVLLVKSSMDPLGKEQAETRLRSLGFPMKRVFIEGPPRDNREYFDTYARIDILLDACLKSEDGHACDALYMGVPVITLCGTLASGMLLCAGFDRLCARSLEEYAEAAEVLAKQPDVIKELQLTLRWQLENTPAMNPDLYMAGLEDGYGRLYCGWQKQVMTDFSKLQKLERDEMNRAFELNQVETVIRKALWLNWSGQSLGNDLNKLILSYASVKDYTRSLFWNERGWGKEPQVDNAVYQRAWNLQMLGRLPETVDFCNRSIEAGAGGELLAKLLSIRAHRAYKMGMKEACEYFFEAYKHGNERAEKLSLYSSWLLVYNGRECGDEELFKKHRDYEKFFKGVEQYQHNRKRRHEKIRVGYISPDFRWHVMQKFILPFFKYRNRDNFEIYGYSMAEEADTYTDRFKAMADGWRDVSPAAPELTAKQIYEDEIDILFELAGHTVNSGLPVMAWKPAPVQLSGLGYMATTGLSTVDYFLTDAFVDPPGAHEDVFVEDLLRINSQFCYTNSDGNLPAPGGAPCRERGWVLFGVFNGYHKYNDEMLIAWRDILSQVPGSKLLIKSQILFAPAMKLVAFDRFKRLGFDMDRVIFEQATTDYMNRYLDVDIALDTYPYPGGGTTCDALYMGVPVISRYGDRHSTRFAYSILQNVGVGELATDSLEGYIERAVAVAKDWELLEYLHRNLRGMMEKSPVMDAKGYMREIEARYREIWEHWLKTGRD